MDDLRSFWSIVAEELAARCCTNSAALDLEYVKRRSESEGESFFMLTLPAYCKELEKALANEAVTQELFPGWRKLPSKQGPSLIPQFLGGFMSLIFDRESGVLLDQPDIDAIFAIRQLTLMYGKLLTPTSESAMEKAIEGYIECEQEIRRVDAQMSPSFLEEFSKASTVLWGTVLQAVDEDVYYHRIIPRHGPGKTADRLAGNRKFDQVEWTERLERVFHWNDFLIPSHRYHHEYLPKVEFLEPGSERPVRVVAVPKTHEKPRLIAIEPTCMQYVQQGLMARLVENIESPYVAYENNHNVGYGVIGFTDQEPNRRLARKGSLTGDLATLDLSEASDRVSYQLVREMLSNYPNLAEGVDACRSRKADVFGKGVIRLAKFASMGSALTFPFEAMVFSTLVFMAIASCEAEAAPPGLRTQVDTDLILRHRSGVRVYGDDIIVPVRFVHRVVEYLQTAGLKVNTNKSFWTGKFRESCGKEYYNGHDVSVVRVRRAFPSRPEHGMDESHFDPRTVDGNSGRCNCYSAPLVDGLRKRRFVPIKRDVTGKSVQSRDKVRSDFVSGVQASQIISCVDLRNQCYMQGLWRSAGFLDEYLQGVLAHYPTVSPESSALGRVSLLGYETQKRDKDTHGPKVRAWRVRSKIPESPVSGVGALLKCLLGKSEDTMSEDHLAWLMAISNADEGHLDRAGRPRSVSITTGWIQPY